MDADMAGISDLSEISSKAPLGHTGIQCPTAIDGNRLEAKAILKPGQLHGAQSLLNNTPMDFRSDSQEEHFGWGVCEDSSAQVGCAGKYPTASCVLYHGHPSAWRREMFDPRGDVVAINLVSKCVFWRVIWLRWLSHFLCRCAVGISGDIFTFHNFWYRWHLDISMLPSSNFAWSFFNAQNSLQRGDALQHQHLGST